MDAIINFQNVSIFQDDYLVLSDVSFTVSSGEFVYLIGRVGSGKTSLIKTINAELPLKEGHAQVAGFHLEKLRMKSVPNRLSGFSATD